MNLSNLCFSYGDWLIIECNVLENGLDYLLSLDFFNSNGFINAFNLGSCDCYILSDNKSLINSLDSWFLYDYGLSVVEGLVLQINLRNFNIYNLSCNGCCVGNVKAWFYNLFYCCNDVEILNLRNFSLFGLSSNGSGCSSQVRDGKCGNRRLDDFYLSCSDCLIEDSKIGWWYRFDELNYLGLINWYSLVPFFDSVLDDFNDCGWSKSIILNGDIRSHNNLLFNYSSEILLSKIERLNNLLSLNFSDSNWLVLNLWNNSLCWSCWSYGDSLVGCGDIGYYWLNHLLDLYFSKCEGLIDCFNSWPCDCYVFSYDSCLINKRYFWLLYTNGRCIVESLILHIYFGRYNLDVWDRNVFKVKARSFNLFGFLFGNSFCDSCHSWACILNNYWCNCLSNDGCYCLIDWSLIALYEWLNNLDNLSLV